MKNALLQKPGIPSSQTMGVLSPRLWLLVIVTLALGIVLRFIHLDGKLYWGDEAFTSLRISGHTWTELVEVFDGHLINSEFLQQYQRINPTKGFIDTVIGLAVDEPHHSPLYYLMAHGWAQVFGSSVATTRALPALLSLLSLPTMYWLCLELFGIPLVGWIAMMLLSVSPYHFVYAQEAREYSLWTLTILLSSVALLRAIRVQTINSWRIYAISLTLGLYTFLFSGLVVVAHGIYLIVIEGLQWTKKIKLYLRASAISLLMFSPWLLLIAINFDSVRTANKWWLEKITPTRFFTALVGNVSRIFLDFGFDSSASLKQIFPLLFPIFGLLILVIYSFYFLCHQTAKRTWSFLLALAVVPVLLLLVRDLFSGGNTAITPRYLFAPCLAIGIAVAYLLATQISSAQLRMQRFWKGILVILVTMGIVSCAVNTQATLWWNKGASKTKQDVEMISIINQVEKPLVISDVGAWHILQMSHLLKPSAGLQLFRSPHVDQVAEGFNTIFLYRPSDELRQDIERNLPYKVEFAYTPHYLWRLVSTTKRQQAKSDV